MRNSLPILLVAFAACEPLGPQMLPGICGPALTPIDVVAAPDVDVDTVLAAVDLWDGHLVASVVPSSRWDACSWGCVGVATVYHAELPDGVLGDTAHATDDAGGVIACDIRLSPWWDVDLLVLGHELGHCLGLGHSDDPGSIMHNPVRPWAAPTDSELELIDVGCGDE